MTKLHVPDGVEWELLVVNNNCTDATDEVIRSFSQKLPIRRLFEPNPGLSNARNHAVQHAKGEYILWTDDDVLVDEEWVIGYCDAFSRFPDAAFFGGPVEPWFECDPPSWLIRILSLVATAYALRSFGGEQFPFSNKIIPFGANYAVRKQEQYLYPYDRSLGVRPNSRMGGEEATILRAMLDAGLTGWWVPKASVRHYIPQLRQTTTYLWGYFFGQGEFTARAMMGEGFREFLGVPFWLWRRAIELEFMYRVHRILSKPEIWIEHLKNSALIWGIVSGLRSQSSQKSGTPRR
jgi:glycosyltransferase involved in cell wall biosynthesis